jgi:hypothetical protein
LVFAKILNLKQRAVAGKNSQLTPATICSNLVLRGLCNDPHNRYLLVEKYSKKFLVTADIFLISVLKISKTGFLETSCLSIFPTF